MVAVSALGTPQSLDLSVISRISLLSRFLPYLFCKYCSLLILDIIIFLCFRKSFEPQILYPTSFSVLNTRLNSPGTSNQNFPKQAHSQNNSIHPLTLFY